MQGGNGFGQIVSGFIAGNPWLTWDPNKLNLKPGLDSKKSRVLILKMGILKMVFNMY